MSKLLVIIGITGNQGGSVASRFLLDPSYRIRGLTRDPSSPRATALAAQGIEIVAADLNDVGSLTKAFEGANLIFSVTNYWEPFFTPANRAEGLDCKKRAGEVEESQGRNIADAAAGVVGTLQENGFIASTLSHAGRCSGGKFKELYHFDAKAAVFPFYVQEKYPELAKKMSCVQTGYFMTSYRLAPGAYFAPQQDGTFVMSFPTAAERAVPHLDVNSDMGPFVYAVSKLPPGKNYLAEGSTCSWAEFCRIWSKVTGKTATYVEASREAYLAAVPDRAFAEETAEMFLYSTEPGYDGGMEGLWRKEDIRGAGVECPMTSLEDFIAKENWASVLSQ